MRSSNLEVFMWPFPSQFSTISCIPHLREPMLLFITTGSAVLQEKPSAAPVQEELPDGSRFIASAKARVVSFL